jgi:hypothetical protein
VVLSGHRSPVKSNMHKKGGIVFLKKLYFLFRSVYNPFTPTADHCEIQFSWKNRECGNLLQLPIIDDEHRNCRLLISIGQKTYSSKIYQDINEQYLRLGKMLNALNNSSTFPGTDLDTGSIDKLLQTGFLYF